MNRYHIVLIATVMVAFSFYSCYTLLNNNIKAVQSNDQHDSDILPLQNLVNRFFRGIEVEFAPSKYESEVIKCQGTPDLNATCLFSNIYVNEQSLTPHAFVIQGSASATRFKSLPNLQLYGTYEGDDRVIVNEFESKEDLVLAAKSSIKHPSDLTAAFTTLWPHNIGHGIFDGIWAIFVGLVRMGLKDDAPFHPYLMRCVDPLNEKDFGLNNFGEGFVSDIYRALSLENSLSACQPGRLGRGYYQSDDAGLLFRFPLFVFGNGHLGQRNLNAEYELPGGRIALGKFRDRIFSSFGIPLFHQDESSCLLRNQRPLKANIFSNKRYSKRELSEIMDAITQVSLMRSVNVDVSFVDWSEVGDVRAQIQAVADTDIYISGPGTGLMLSTLLNDGSILLNLGHLRWTRAELHPFPSYMEEYLVAASPHLRALYYDRCLFPEINSHELTSMIVKAADMIRSCFETSSDHYSSVVNKSPIARAYTDIFNKMVSGLDQIPRYYYTTMVNECDWAEEFVYGSSACMKAVDAYGWDQKKYRQAFDEALAQNNIRVTQCTRWDKNEPCDSRDCVFSHINTQVTEPEGQAKCMLGGDGQGRKATFDMTKLYEKDECIVVSGGISEDYLMESYFEKEMAKHCIVYAFDCTVKDKEGKMASDGVVFSPVCIGSNKGFGEVYEEQYKMEACIS